MVKQSAPGYYRTMVGDFEVTALSDGTTGLPVDQILAHVPKGAVQKALADDYETLPYEMNFNGYLVNTGAKLVLVDTGAGRLFGPNLGRLVERLRASGYQPEQVDEIYITHMHPDHVGGLVADGKRVFPNAVVRADKREADYWLSAANLAKAPDSSKDFFKGAQASLAPYVEAHRFVPFEGATDLVPGVRAVPLLGHTPGHAGYFVESKGKTLLLWGDLMHVGEVQFASPEVTIQFDSDSKQAQAVRVGIFAEAARRGYLVGGSHIAFPGLGHLRRAGKGYRWIPVSYTELH